MVAGRCLVFALTFAWKTKQLRFSLEICQFSVFIYKASSNEVSALPYKLKWKRVCGTISSPVLCHGMVPFRESQVLSATLFCREIKTAWSKTLLVLPLFFISGCICMNVISPFYISHKSVYTEHKWNGTGHFEIWEHLHPFRFYSTFVPKFPLTLYIQSVFGTAHGSSKYIGTCHLAPNSLLN